VATTTWTLSVLHNAVHVNTIKWEMQAQIKGLVHPKMKILSVFTHPQVVPNLYVFICSAEHKGRYLEECFNQTDLIPH